MIECTCPYPDPREEDVHRGCPIHGDEMLLREIAISGVEFDDERIKYVVVQIDRDIWNRLQALHAKESSATQV